MAYSVRKDGCAHTGGIVPMEVVRILRLHYHIISGEVSNITSDVRARYRFNRCSSTFKTLITDLEKLALLRVHVRSFDIVDAKEAVIETSDVLFEEVPTPGVHATWTLGVRMVKGVDVPARGRNVTLA